MGCNAKNKRANRKARLLKPDSDSSSSLKKKWMVPYKYHDTSSNDSDSSPNVLSSSWVFCNESQLEDILLKNIEIVCSDTVSKVVALGYSDDVALKAIMHSGQCDGGRDLATNLLHNALAWLKEGNLGEKCECNHGLSDLKKLGEYTLMSLVSLLKEMRPELGRGDAMWCILMSNFHVAKARGIQIPVDDQCPPLLSEIENEEWGFGNGGSSNFPLNAFLCGTEMSIRLQRDIEFPKRLDLTPEMKRLLKKNVSIFAAGFRATSRHLQSRDGVFPVFPEISTFSRLYSSSVSGTAVLGEQPGDPHNMTDQDELNSVLSKFVDLNIDKNSEFVAEDEKDEAIVTLVQQIKDLEKQAMERKDWAREKAIQAARKLSSDMIDLKMFKLEKEENQKREIEREAAEALDDPTMKRLSGMENDLRKASAQIDQANTAVRKLQAEKAEIKAELEASKLSASESVANCLQVAKREKKCLKKLLAWEKQKAKIQQDISDEKQKILVIQEELAQIKQCAKEVEVARTEELKAKEEALALIEEERRSKDAIEANRKRNLKALRLKIEIDFQRRKDDLLRLEQEIARLKASSESATLPTSESEFEDTDTLDKLLQEIDDVRDFSGKKVNSSRECIICGKDEVSVIFLPCAHQVMCASCGKEYGRKGKVICPCCRVPIVQRIRIFGTTS